MTWDQAREAVRCCCTRSDSWRCLRELGITFSVACSCPCHDYLHRDNPDKQPRRKTRPKKESGMKPLVIDLFCGLGGWSKGFLAEGYDAIGFDIERHAYGDKRYPGQLVLQDVLTLHGSQFRNAACIVASPPCQEFSYMAMPWKRAKQIAAALRGQGEFPEGYTGSRTVAQLTAMFDACFRIQRQAIQASTCSQCGGDGRWGNRKHLGVILCPSCSGSGKRHIPLVVENVRGAQPWVGRAPWNYGSYYLWGDVPAIMPFTHKAQKRNPDGTNHGQGSWFAIADSKERGSQKVPGFRFDGSGRSFQTASVNLTNQRESDAVKTRGDWFGRGDGCSPMRMREEDYQKWLGGDGTKQQGLSGPAWFDRGAASHGSKSHARKAASAMIAEIPFDLARWIASVFHA